MQILTRVVLEYPFQQQGPQLTTSQYVALLLPVNNTADSLQLIPADLDMMEHSSYLLFPFALLLVVEEMGTCV